MDAARARTLTLDACYALAMNLGEQELEHLARLARLELSDEERGVLRTDLEQVLSYLGELSKIDVDGLEPMLRPIHVGDGTRTDEVRPGLEPERARQLARHREQLFLRVPRTGGDDG